MRIRERLSRRCEQVDQENAAGGSIAKTEDADLVDWNVPITGSNPFHWRHYPGDIILWCVRWYLRYPLSVAQMAEMTMERGLAISPSCIWRWVQVYGPELDKRCRRHLKPTNKSWRLDETYITWSMHRIGAGVRA